jgi:hypothetical protein
MEMKIIQKEQLLEVKEKREDVDEQDQDAKIESNNIYFY